MENNDHTTQAVTDYLFKYKAISNAANSVIGNLFVCVWITIALCWWLFDLGAK